MDESIIGYGHSSCGDGRYRSRGDRLVSLFKSNCFALGLKAVPMPLKIIVIAGLISLACWWVVVLRLRGIPRPEGYKGGILRRYRENFPKSPIVMFIRTCSVVSYGTLAYWI